MMLSKHGALVLVVAGCATTAPQPTAQPEPQPTGPAILDAGTLADATDDRADTLPHAAVDAGFRPLFDGVDLAGWDRYLGIPVGETTALGLENDPRGVFSVVTIDGEPALHVTGEVWGALISKEDHANFELRLQYKWGTKQWPPLNAIDSGVMVLSTGPLGAVNAGGDALSDPIGSGAFMVSIEFQLASWDIGGLYNLGPIAKQSGPRSSPAPVPSAWNDVAIVVRGAASQHFLNGQLVTSATGYELRWPGQPVVPLDHGKIQLQSEGAEIYFRHVEIRSLE
jgi:hypothetical protein